MASRLARTSNGIGTTSTRVWNDNGHFTVQLHSTVVYDETRERVLLNNGGWITPTTVRRMNQALEHREFKADVRILKGRMFYGNEPFQGSELSFNKCSECRDRAITFVNGRPKCSGHEVVTQLVGERGNQ